MQAIFFRIALFITIGYILVCIIYFFIQEKIIFFPEKLPSDYKFKFSWEFEEVFLETDKNATIHGLHFKHRNPKGIIIYFHGNAGSLRSWGELSYDFRLYPYDFFIYDFRSYGKSTGKRSEKAMYKDAKFCVEYAKQFYDEDQIILYGRSLGSGLATYCASHYNVKKVILETPYYNLYDLARHYAPFVPYKLLMRYSFRSDQFIHKINCPIYIFHGTKDRVIPYSSAKKLSTKMKITDKFITIPGGNHNNLADFEIFRYELKKALIH